MFLRTPLSFPNQFCYFFSLSYYILKLKLEQNLAGNYLVLLATYEVSQSHSKMSAITTRIYIISVDLLASTIKSTLIVEQKHEY
jgi:hypothetical protein